ncbi:MAG TPA: PKD domain-containing protein [Vicinamibacterales bacterium]
MKSDEPPPFAGPSELDKSITVAVSPDVLSLDGASQSLITVTAKDGAAQPIRNLTLRVETRVDGVPVDFGSLSARSIVTNGEGVATVVYTAPRGAPLAGDDGTFVEIVVTPIGSDFNNTSTRRASIRLVPSGVVFPPASLQPAFTVTPSGPQENQTVLFDASTTQGSNIVDYQWTFGDGGRASGVLTQHAFPTAGTYVVTLTVVDAIGRSASTAQAITVTPGQNPTAAFNFSPTNPRVGQQMTFNASASRPPAGARIVSYTWEWGDGSDRVTTGDVLVAHTFTRSATFTVTLIVTDNFGRTASVSLTLQVAP